MLCLGNFVLVENMDDCNNHKYDFFSGKYRRGCISFFVNKEDI